jgi:chromosome segregation ATPase
MRALQELRAANEKIAELEKKLEDATTKISRLATRHSSSTSTSAPEQPDQPRGSTNITRNTVPAASTSLITLSYETGWDTAFLHFQVDDQRK